jgi:hypothetical protein
MLASPILEVQFMEIVRNADGTLVIPMRPQRHSEGENTDSQSEETGGDTKVLVEPETRVLHPGEGGYDEALAEWDIQQNPDRPPAVSTVTGRQEAMSLVHEVAISSDHAVAPAIDKLDDPEASAEALRHVLIGGVHSVADFAEEVAEAEGGEPLSAHETTKIIGEVLTELD